jgi:superfamily I DNA/RNA helicase
MRVLSDVRPTRQQRAIIADYKPGFTLIRGAAGSGKTTTAVLRLRHVTGVYNRQRQRAGTDEPIRVLVLTFNRTLRGYIEELVGQQISAFRDVDLTLDTFGRWAWRTLGEPDVITNSRREAIIWRFGAGLGLERSFLLDEVEYIVGRYAPEDLRAYATPSSPSYERRGRGTSPRVEQALRTRILDEVVGPYDAWKQRENATDWNDLATRLRTKRPTQPYDVVIVDEAQDFSANQVRGLIGQLAPTHSTTFVLDGLQQIYPRGFTWREAGIDQTSLQTFRLDSNFRNTAEIAAFARPLVEGIERNDDGTPPDPSTCERHGPKPLLVRGRFSKQMDWVVSRLRDVPAEESVALLHPRGGGWFDYPRDRLKDAGYDFVELTRRSEWPQGPENIALSTLHSAKGLEFDHVVILGLNAELLRHGSEEHDAQLENHRRLLAMASARARKTLAVSFKPEEASSLVRYFRPGTYDEVDAEAQS